MTTTSLLSNNASKMLKESILTSLRALLNSKKEV